MVFVFFLYNILVLLNIYGSIKKFQSFKITKLTLSLPVIIHINKYNYITV